MPELKKLIEKLDWDTGFFGFNIALIKKTTINENDVKKINLFCKKKNIRLLSFACSQYDRKSILLAEKNNFNFADIRITFELEVTDKIFKKNNSKNIQFKKATLKDVNQIKDISKNLFIDSRYYFDTNFPRNKVKNFYQNWSEKAVYGLYDDYAYILKENSKILAFITIKIESKKTANISLIGVNAKYQNKGLGSLLLNRTIIRLKKLNIKKIYVVTQGRNYYAQNLYQANDFKTKSLQLWYHKWF